MNKVRKNRFNLVILDIVLPDIRGNEVAINIMRQNDSINIIFITGHPQFQDYIDPLDIDIYKILLKHISPDDILRSTKKVL